MGGWRMEGTKGWWGSLGYSTQDISYKMKGRLGGQVEKPRERAMRCREGGIWIGRSIDLRITSSVRPSGGALAFLAL
jgi:hypothetical protein